MLVFLEVNITTIRNVQREADDKRLGTISFRSIEICNVKWITHFVYVIRRLIFKAKQIV